MPLLDSRGNPMQTFKKAKPPELGPAFGDWAGRHLMDAPSVSTGGLLQFDLSALTLGDYRAMSNHPQINSSLSVLSFMIHQIEWKVVCDDKKIKEQIEENLHDVWSQMVRALCMSFKFGYAPIVLDYKNDAQGRFVVIDKFKDLLPEECRPNWKRVEGYAPPGHPKPKFLEYDGIVQAKYAAGGWQSADYMTDKKVTRAPGVIPPEHTLWYPLLMEQGDYFGKKLLNPAFMPWYFSQLTHIYANRYYERFGEPVPVGRYQQDAEVQMSDGSIVTARQAMELILTSLRSRGVVMLPSDRDPITKEYDFGIEYLESNMRGGDFEKYLSRLDEEMALAIFTPVLLFKSGDVGSNNLGVQHAQTFMWMINALIGDMKHYIDQYVIKRLRDFNWGPKAAKATFDWKRLGKENTETMRAMVAELLRSGKVGVDLEDMGQSIGMKLHEIKIVTEPDDPTAPGQVTPIDKNKPETDLRTGRSRAGAGSTRRGVGESRATGRKLSARTAAQVANAWRTNGLADFRCDFGHQTMMVRSMEADGLPEPEVAQARLYERLEAVMADLVAIKDQFEGPNDLMALFERHLDLALADFEATLQDAA